jgi:hypothetical protein
LEELPEIDDTTVALINKAKQAVTSAVDNVEERKKRKEAEDEEHNHSSEWSYMSSVSRESPIKEAPHVELARRSVFDDVDS